VSSLITCVSLLLRQGAEYMLIGPRKISGAREVLGLVLGYTFYYISQNPSSQYHLCEALETGGHPPGSAHDKLMVRFVPI